jgi:ribulose-phosphate 3-epimerase
MVEISASLLAADYANLGDEVRRAEAAGVDSFHFDMMDGHYVPNLALAPQHLTSLRPYTSLPFHVHLELSNPDFVISKFTRLDANVVILQIDTVTNAENIFSQIMSLKHGLGLGLNPDDPLEKCKPYLPDIDLLLILGVYPGFGGQGMQPGILEKIRDARKLVDNINPSVRIFVDGGIKPENACEVVRAGADCIIMGTALFQADQMKEIVAKIRGSIVSPPPR